jgi:hypothetical protein
MDLIYDVAQFGNLTFPERMAVLDPPALPPCRLGPYQAQITEYDPLLGYGFAKTFRHDAVFVHASEIDRRHDSRLKLVRQGEVVNYASFRSPSSGASLRHITGVRVAA